MPLLQRTLVPVAIVSITGCALFMRPSVQDAARVAEHNLCGREAAYADTSCRIERTDRLRAGYRFILVRRPPAGNDRLAVIVQGGSVYATRIDSMVLVRLRVLDSVRQTGPRGRRAAAPAPADDAHG